MRKFQRYYSGRQLQKSDLTHNLFFEEKAGFVFKQKKTKHNLNKTKQNKTPL